MGRLGLTLILALAAILLVAGIIYNQVGYKICPNCTAKEYFQRGLEYSCNKNKDYRITAVRFFRRAAKQGEFQAKLLLAELYLQDFPKGYSQIFPRQVACLAKDVSPDRKKAISYFKQVIEGIKTREAVPAGLLYNIYLLYAKGILPSENPKETAHHWLVKAAEAGSHAAMVLLAKAADASGDYVRARKWYEMASNDPTDWESPLKVGDYYFYGKGTSVDYVQAEKWYKKAFNAAKQLASKVDSEEERAKIEAAPKVRLDIVSKRLEIHGGKKAKVSLLEYKLEGRVKEYLVYVKEPAKDNSAFKLAGKVINKDGKIIATMNNKLKFAVPLKSPEKSGFKSMVDGMKWVLSTYATHIKEKDKGAGPFDFILTRS